MVAGGCDLVLGDRLAGSRWGICSCSRSPPAPRRHVSTRNMSLGEGRSVMARRHAKPRDPSARKPVASMPIVNPSAAAIDVHSDNQSSSPGGFHPQALTEPDGSLSTHPALITQPLAASPRQVPPHCWVDPTSKPGDWAPSLHAHYRHFYATTSPSAPVPRIGTLALVGLPLGLLPCHRGDRFPGSMF